MRLPHLLLLALSIPAPAAAAPPHPAPHRTGPAAPSAACARLAADYENASKSLAYSFAEGMGDNSAPRATMREAADNNTLAQARMTMDLLRGNGCPLPTSAPSAARYFGSAITCKTDELQAEIDRLEKGKPVTGIPASCDQSKWVPEPKSGG